MGDFNDKKSSNKILLFALSFLTMGALVSVSGQVTNIECLIGLTCDPNPITGVGNVTLDEAALAEIGGVRASNCTGTDKVTGIGALGALLCGTDTTGAGAGGILEITLGEGLGSNETPISVNASLFLQNASILGLGGVRVANCTSGDFVSGWLGNMSPICTTEENGTVTQLAQGSGITLFPEPISTTGIISATNATTIDLGVVLVANCSASNFVDGWASSLAPQCSTAVTSISEGTGMSFSVDPIVTTGTINLDTAAVASIGGILASNCTGEQKVTGVGAAGALVCGADINGTLVAAQPSPNPCDSTAYGEMFHDSDTGISYVCDASRDKWLSLDTATLFGEETSACAVGNNVGNDNCNVDWGNGLGPDVNNIGFYIPYNATIIAGGFSQDNNACLTGSYDVEIWGSASSSDDNDYSSNKVEVVTVQTGETWNDNSLNVNVNGPRYVIWGIDNNCGETIDDYAIVLYLKWRHD